MQLSSKLTDRIISANGIPLNPEEDSASATMYGKTLNTVKSIYTVNMNDSNAGEEIKTDVIAQLKNNKIDPSTGNPYVMINGVKIEFDKNQLSNIGFDENNMQVAIGGNTNLVYAVEYSEPETFKALVEFAAANPTQNGEPITVASMWRPQVSDRAHFEGRAVDFDSFSSGTKVNAAESGTVKLAALGAPANHYSGYGYSVVIKGSDGTEYLYAHNQESSFQVQNGATVNTGNYISQSGSSGLTFGNPHVHFEVITPNNSIYIR